ncbi:TRAP transporter substrate-binding protein DctP [Jannaschia aquimarina]|uniref:SiaP_2 protein n=1 Tax=Jannaschia aquimarina TaxID=935700 RepID=A0A0D1D4M7_9RHOB|nr:TRAP transporter substrate-binding protein DctP [Jannaschia aquimarina]KIT15028.1 Sialic acid-binding periplasmic protein SiaP precursor [Jannaschia aquimarina]SNS62295.1 TRAP-type C4-dicarboxylate transport system, substrate-binding protein [Jannaschia aquimarina]
MKTTILALAVASLAVTTNAGHAQTLKFSTVGKGGDPDAVAMRVWEAYIEENSDLEVDVFDSASLVEQGKQGQALARGTVDAAYMSPAWFTDQAPKWEIFATPYLLTGPEHICAVRQSDIWDDMVVEIEDAMGLRILDAAYQGTRTLNLRERRDVNTPADLEGLALRVVPSPSNILMGEGLGANPTPVPFSELYLALQTGTVDAQENPLTLIHSQKFYEVTEQIVDTRHKVLIQFPAFSARNWQNLTAEQQQVVSDGAREAMAAYTQSVIDLEASLQETLEAEGIVFTQPDVEAFRSAVQTRFLESDLAANWEEGMFETIAGMDIPAECQTDS